MELMDAVKEPRRAQSEREKKRQRRGRQTASRQKCSARDAATKRSKISVISFFFFFFFLVVNFRHLAKLFLVNNVFCHKFTVFLLKFAKRPFQAQKKSAKKATIAHNMKGCLRFSIFLFLVSPNLANIIMNEFFGKKTYVINSLFIKSFTTILIF